MRVFGIDDADMALAADVLRMSHSSSTWLDAGCDGAAASYREGIIVRESLKLPELLAPAGNAECLHAAACAGADAVYLGLDEFNARRNAGNFTLDEFPEVCDYAHLRGMSVFVTMNVEILPSELERAVRYVHDAYRAGADAFIVQDIGLAREMARTLPAARLHVSTQMNVHNAAGVVAAAQLGARRVTLARELSLPEIAELASLAADFDMEVETFAHGALCICYSGQCLMSSMIGGRSANRGLCAQACRLPYELRREGHEGALPAEGEHLLSPRDLCTIDILQDLVDAGVASLKIEGRMKSADYVYEVVSVYREALDDLGARALGDGTDADPAASSERRERLAEAFSRGFTTAYLQDQRGNDIMSYGRPNNRGVFVGRVAAVSGEVVRVLPEMQLNEGDILEFWTNRGRFAATVADPRPASDGTVALVVDGRTAKGDRVFRVRNAQRAFVDAPFEPRIPVRGSVRLRIGEPAHIEFETTRHPFAKGEAQGSVVEPARTKPLSEDDVIGHVNRLGQTPYVISGGSDAGVLDLQIELDEGAGMGFSQLHHLRSDALDALTNALLESYSGRTEAAFEPFGIIGGSRERDCKVMAWATNPACARAAKRAGAEAVYVPILNFRRGQAQLAGVRQDDPEQAGYPKQCVMALPTVDHDPLPNVREYALSFDPWDYVREGKTVFADSLGACVRALECGARVEVGSHVPLTNAAALAAVAEMGASRVWLSPELTLGQIDDLARASQIDLGITVSGSQELMICEHCLLMSQGPCKEECETCPRRSAAHKLVDRKGFEFPVVTDVLGRSHLYNGIELDVLSSLPDLIDIGVSAIMVDTTLMDKRTASDAIGRALRARDMAMSEHRPLAKRPNTTTGHLFRGVS